MRSIERRAYLGGGEATGAGLGGGAWERGRGPAVMLVGLTAYCVGGTAAAPFTAPLHIIRQRMRLTH